VSEALPVLAGCRDRCLETGEPLAGSAGRVTAWFGIAWPKPRWHAEHASRSSGLPPELRELELAAKRGGRKLALRTFQRAPRPSTAAVELIALEPQSGRCEVAPALPLPGLLAALRRFLEGAPIGPALARPTLLVCTDGKHDRCCAAHGRPLFEATRSSARQNGLALDVLESSHLGGHRFASTLLALPEGRLYGRVPLERADELACAVADGRVLGAHDRGRLGRAELEQLAESAARRLLPEAEAFETHVVSEASETLDLLVNVRSRGTKGCVRLSCRRRAFHSPSSCDNEPEQRDRWIIEQITPA
jgi:hypothetical protein